MSEHRRLRAGAAAGFVLAAAVMGVPSRSTGDPPEVSGSGKETDVTTATKQAPARRVPPLDAAAPQKFETATFALG